MKRQALRVLTMPTMPAQVAFITEKCVQSVVKDTMQPTVRPFIWNNVRRTETARTVKK